MTQAERRAYVRKVFRDRRVTASNELIEAIVYRWELDTDHAWNAGVLAGREAQETVWI